MGWGGNGAAAGKRQRSILWAKERLAEGSQGWVMPILPSGKSTLSHEALWKVGMHVVTPTGGSSRGVVQLQETQAPRQRFEHVIHFRTTAPDHAFQNARWILAVVF